MPVSPNHFRAYQNNYLPHTDSNLTHQANSVRQTHRSDPAYFPPLCARALNCAEELTFLTPPPDLPRSAMAYAVRFLLLLSQIQPAETAFPLHTGNALTTALNSHDAHAAFVPPPSLNTDKTIVSGQIKNQPPTFSANGLMPLWGAAAAAITSNDEGVIRYADNTTFLLTNEEKIKLLFADIKNFLVANEQLREDEGDAFELEMRTLAAGYPVLIYEVSPSLLKFPRNRRALAAHYDAKIKEHIKDNCALEEEVLDTEGNNKGKLLIFQAQRAESPFRVIYDNNPDGKPTPDERGIAEGLDIAVNIFSIGMKSFIGNMIASAKRHEYYQNQGDTICSERYKHLMLAEVATTLEVDALPYRQRSQPGLIKPSELTHALAIQERAAFYTRPRAPHNKIRKEILFSLKQGNEAIIDDNGRNIYLKSTGKEGEFITRHPHAVNPKLLERKVIIDENTLTWRYADRFDISGLNVEVREGKSHIELHGEYYELNLNKKNKYEIVIKKGSGITEYVPVYMEPLSRNWHLKTHNKYPVFNKKQEKLIDKIKVNLDNKLSYFPMQNNNPKKYGSGRLFRAEKTGDASHYVQGEFIEMRGELIPVRQKVTRGHGVHYETFDKGKSYPVEWDGNRWIFEQSTSPHVSKEFKALITRDMFAQNINAGKISASDNYGLKWDDQGRTYLKIKNNYVKINKLNGNRFSIHSPEGRIILRFRKNKFFKETSPERFDNILTVGLNGPKRKHAIDILKDVDGFTPASAAELLSRYDFPKNGFFSGHAFALHIEQNGALPHWEKRFRKAQPEIVTPHTATVTDSVPVTSWSFPDLHFDLPLGNAPGEGALKHLSNDGDNNAFAIKKFSVDQYAVPFLDAINEANNFNTYYGHGAAQIFYDRDYNYYVRLNKISGVNLHNIPASSLPADADKKFVDIFETFNEVGIPYNNLRAENIVWDAHSQAFYPTGSLDVTPGTSSGVTSSNEQKIYWTNVLSDLNKKKAPQGKAEAPAGQITKHYAQDGAVAGPSREAAPPPAELSFSEMLSKKEVVNSLLRSCTLNSEVITHKLDKISAAINENDRPLLQKKQIHRMQELLRETENAVNNGEDLTELTAFITRNTPEVLNPGHSLSQQYDESFTIATIKWDTDLYRIRTTKQGAESINLLFPENGEVTLKQNELDATAYEVAVAQLSDNERDALRTWSALPLNRGAAYSDGTKATGRQINYELNRNLREGRKLPAAQQKIYDNMLSALNKNIIPAHQGEYIRTAAYYDVTSNPWLKGKIKSGYYVSNFKQFMSVSSDTMFAKAYSTTIGAGSRAIVNYKIKTQKGPTPLLPLALSLLSYENEFLYKPHSLFKVLEYSVSEKLPPLRFHPQPPGETGQYRIAVILEEIDPSQIRNHDNIMDIYSGRRKVFRAPMQTR